MSSEFDGRVALVTGAASGIGLAVARQLVERGAVVIALDRDGAALDALAPPGDESSHPAGEVLGFELDITERDAVRQRVAQVEREVGPIEWVVNAAGLLLPGSLLGESAASDFMAQQSVHVGGLLNLMQAVAPRMLERRRGSVVAISSNAGTTPRVAMGGYCASKAAATMLMRCFALELAPHVRCNVVSPGSTSTPMLRKWTGSEGPEALVAGDALRFKLGIPLGRIATPDDIANVTVFLLSRQAVHVTGQDWKVDGGATF